MAGQTRFSFNKLDRAFAPENAAAFCEGMAYRVAGTAASNPQIDNPYAQDPEVELWGSWNEGWEAANAQAGPQLSYEGLNCPNPQNILL